MPRARCTESRPRRCICTRSGQWMRCSTSWAQSRDSSSSGSKRCTLGPWPWGTDGWRRNTAVCRCRRRPPRSCWKGSSWRVAGGWGAGQRNPKHYPNALRILIAEQAAEAGRVTLLATDVDDMSPEYVEPLRQALVAAGAVDVQTWPVQMKKGRSGFRVEVVAPEEVVEAVTAALFRHSTTAGVRRWVAERATLARRQVTVQLSPEVAVRVKVLEQPDSEGVRVKPEYDDVLAAARALGRPPLEVARVAQRDAEALVAKSKE